VDIPVVERLVQIDGGGSKSDLLALGCSRGVRLP